MFPTDFDGSNHIFDKPDDMSREECDPMNAFVGMHDETPVTITCWKLTKEELEEINKTGRVWCWHWGHALQPHNLSGISPEFKESK